MRKRSVWKRLSSICLVLVLMLAMAMPAMAAPSGTVNITIRDGSAAGKLRKSARAIEDGSRQYDGYRLLDLTMNLKCEKAEPDHTHTDACYNYAYTVNEKYREIMQQVVYDAIKDQMDPSATAANVMDAQIIEYLEKQTSDSVNSKGEITQMGSIRNFIENVYQKIKEPDSGIDADVSNPTGVFQNANQGYWMFVDKSTISGSTDDAYSLLIADTKGQSDLTLTPKISVPTVTKKVQENSTGAWGDYADWNIGDHVPFKLTGTVADYMEYYDTYKYIFHDDLSDGLEFNADSVKVTLGSENGTEIPAAVTLADGTVHTNYEVKMTGLGDGCDFHVEFTDLKKIKGKSDTAADAYMSITKADEIVVCYTAKLTEDAEIGTPGNPNEVYLEFSNNPNSSGDGTGKTPEDEVVVFTFELDGTKVDKNSWDKGSQTYTKPLPDAWFVLYRDSVTKDPADVSKYLTEYAEIDDNGNITGWSTDKPQHGPKGQEVDGNLQSDTNGDFKLVGLDQGIYYLEETVAPVGFRMLEKPIKLEIEAEYSVDPEPTTKLHTLTKLTITVPDPKDPTKTISTSDTSGDGIVDITIENSAGMHLPSTGGMGTTIFYILGGILSVGALVIFITRKRMGADTEK